jgi:type II secretory pathway pseudopilin PulG
LLVVIAIIGILISLMLPAIQASREAARRVKCANNLKQMALAFQMHHDSMDVFPSGGWGENWLGDPDRGFGKEQSGTWTYSILPFMEQQAVFTSGTDGQPDVITPKQMSGAAAACQTVIPQFYCPTRRTATLYPVLPYAGHKHGAPIPNDFAWNCNRVDYALHCDYAANMGDTHRGAESLGGPAPAEAFDGTGFFLPDIWTGICYRRSEVSMGAISDGVSNTYMIGERYFRGPIDISIHWWLRLADRQCAFAGWHVSDIGMRPHTTVSRRKR